MIYIICNIVYIYIHLILSGAWLVQCVNEYYFSVKMKVLIGCVSSSEICLLISLAYVLVVLFLSV